jgi:Ricin-type beta-trefoil lectin domain
MRIFMKAVTSTVTVGLLAFGVVAGSGGSALAGPAPAPTPDVPITGCSTSVTGVTVGFVPNCTAIAGTMDHPNTSIVIGFEETTDLLSKLVDDQNGQGFTAQWSLACDVDGATVTAPGSYTVTSTSQVPFTTIDLQSAVGSPDPSQCSVDGLTMHTLLPLVAVDIDEAVPFQIAVAALATTAAPGAIRQDEGTTSRGAHAALCADDTADGNAGSKIQGFECLSDLAQAFVQTSTGQLVNNGDCMTATVGGGVLLDKCVADDTAQRWTQTTPGGTLKNMSTGTCLTVPSVKNGTPLTVAACGGAVRQQWELPKLTPAPVSPRAALGAALDRK